MHLVVAHDSTVAVPSSIARELACRDNDGFRVVLLWHPRTDTITVSVEDSRTGDAFELAVERHQALDAFYHPFAYDRRPIDDLPLAA